MPESTRSTRGQYVLDLGESGDPPRGLLRPKKPLADPAGGADIFPYYAGFSFDWARDQLSRVKNDGIVLDPWNGSGTTTLAAQSLNRNSIGGDLNPVAQVVSRARMIRAPKDLVSRLPRGPARGIVSTADPLDAWFTSRVVGRLRGWLRSFEDAGPAAFDLGRLALFLTVQQLTTRFQGSNPTWVRVAANADDLVYVRPAELDAIIQERFQFVFSRNQSVAGHAATWQVRASSRRLPIKTDSVSTILTSPPYLTRIDYAISYRRELAVLGYEMREKNSLRAALMGTTSVRSQQLGQLGDNSVAGALLKNIAGHSSYASKTYYFKQARQYIDDLRASLREVTRVAKADARLTLVVQDSFYKDLLVPLSDICIDETERLGWDCTFVKRDQVTRSMGTLNISAKKYKKTGVDESIIELRRASHT